MAVPFVITADEAFSLASYMLKPYPRKSPTVEERIANCRISRGRRISENIVGILANGWRCFRAPLLLSPVKVQRITMAVLSLRNLLNSDRFSRNVYCPRGPTDNENPVTGEIIQGTWRDDSPLKSLVSLQPSLKHNYNRGAQEMRQEYTRWFNDEGDVPWQRKMCGL